MASISLICCSLRRIISSLSCNWDCRFCLRASNCFWSSRRLSASSPAMPLILEVSICGGGAFLTGAATGLTGSASATGAGGGVAP